MDLLKLFAIALGVLFLAQVAPRLLIRSDLERFFGVEGPSIQYAGIAHTYSRLGYCGGGPVAFVCTAVRITEVKFVNPGLGKDSLRKLPGCTYPYEATAQVYSWFGIPIQTVKIDCNVGTTLVR